MLLRYSIKSNRKTRTAFINVFDSKFYLKSCISCLDKNVKRTKTLVIVKLLTDMQSLYLDQKYFLLIKSILKTFKNVA